jgi:hypothetical protein
MQQVKDSSIRRIMTSVRNGMQVDHEITGKEAVYKHGKYVEVRTCCVIVKVRTAWQVMIQVRLWQARSYSSVLDMVASRSDLRYERCNVHYVSRRWFT